MYYCRVLIQLLPDLSASDVSSEAAQKKVEEAVALFASIVASTNIDATEFFTQLSKDAALLTSSTTILSEENANSLSTSLETLAEVSRECFVIETLCLIVNIE